MPYVTVAAAIGVTTEEIDIFFNRLQSTLQRVRAMASRRTAEDSGQGKAEA